MNELFLTNEIIACISCLAPNEVNAYFCEICGAPLGNAATLDLLKMIRTEAFLVGKATTVKKTALIVLSGIWVIFLPALLGGAAIAYLQFSEGFGFGGFLFFWIGIGLALASVVFLYRVTKNYSIPDSLPDEE